MSREGTLTASEQKFLEIIFQLQKIGALPQKPWNVFNPGRVVWADSGEDRELKIITRHSARRMSVEWNASPDVAFVLEVLLRHTGKKLAGEHEFRQIGKYEWIIGEIDIKKVTQVNFGAGSFGADVEHIFQLTDPVSIQFLMRLPIMTDDNFFFPK